MNRRAVMPVLGASPRASLLPPEIRVRAHLKTLSRLMVAAVAAIAVLAVAATGITTVLASAAAGELDRSRAQTAALLAEQATYSEASDLETEVAVVTAAQAFAASTEVAWSHYLDLAGVTLPASMRIEDVTASAAAPWQVSAAPTGPLRGLAVATFQLTVSSSSEGDITGWARSLSALPGFADSSIDGLSFIADVPEGENNYSSTITLNLDASARTGRFAPEIAAVEPVPVVATAPTTNSSSTGSSTADAGE